MKEMEIYKAYYHKPFKRDELNEDDMRDLLRFLWHVLRGYEATISCLMERVKERPNKEYLTNMYKKYK